MHLIRSYAFFFSQPLHGNVKHLAQGAQLTFSLHAVEQLVAGTHVVVDDLAREDLDYILVDAQAHLRLVAQQKLKRAALDDEDLALFGRHHRSRTLMAVEHAHLAHGGYWV